MDGLATEFKYFLVILTQHHTIPVWDNFYFILQEVRERGG